MHILRIFLLTSINFIRLSHGVSFSNCERWKVPFEFTQENAPKDIAMVTHEVTKKVNREKVGVKQVRVLWAGDVLHAIVGTHIVQAQITRIKQQSRDSNDVEETCYDFVFNIKDIDECVLPVSHKWRHRCSSTAACRNSQGSYYCACTESFSKGVYGLGACAGEADTSSCCSVGKGAGPSAEVDCHARFQCYTNECPGDCSSMATCAPTYNSSRYVCSCPPTHFGNGRTCRTGVQPLVLRDPRHDSLLYNADRQVVSAATTCGCVKPLIDHCSMQKCGLHEHCVNDHAAGKGQCVCDKGYLLDPKNRKEFGCVDASMPKLRLKGPSVLEVEQCHSYEEYGVEIDDENAEEYGRTLTIDYDPPISDCLREMTGFTVRYRIETKWTDPPYQIAERQVRVVNTNECAARTLSTDDCADCLPQCSNNAICVDTPGSYTCRCPTCAVHGDGFMRLPQGAKRPVGYVNGSGCSDSCAPLIKLQGPNPRIFRVPKCHGLPMISGVESREWDADMKRLVREHPEELCTANPNTPAHSASHFLDDSAASRSSGNSNWRLWADKQSSESSFYPKDSHRGRCAVAMDETVTGTVDLTDKIRIGVPEMVGKNQWKVPYDVSDEVGNHAITAYRIIQVVEYSLDELEDALTALQSQQPTCPAAPKCQACPARASCPLCPHHPQSVKEGGHRKLSETATLKPLPRMDDDSIMEDIWWLAKLLFFLLASMTVLYLVMATGYGPQNFEDQYERRTANFDFTPVRSSPNQPHVSSSQSPYSARSWQGGGEITNLSPLSGDRRRSPGGYGGGMTPNGMTPGESVYASPKYGANGLGANNPYSSSGQAYTPGGLSSERHTPGGLSSERPSLLQQPRSSSSSFFGS